MAELIRPHQRLDDAGELSLARHDHPGTPAGIRFIDGRAAEQLGVSPDDVQCRTGFVHQRAYHPFALFLEPAQLRDVDRGAGGPDHGPVWPTQRRVAHAYPDPPAGSLEAHDDSPHDLSAK